MSSSDCGTVACIIQALEKLKVLAFLVIARPRSNEMPRCIFGVSAVRRPGFVNGTILDFRMEVQTRLT